VRNVGSGQSYSIREIAERLAVALDRSDITPDVTGKFRPGDIRHCFADVSRARERLGFIPRVSLEDGLAELVAWLDGQEAEDRVEAARAELAARGLAT
jgi:dTDP-L-rhamnose 4-epimerase